MPPSCRYDDGREKESEELEVLTHEHEGRVGEDMYGTGKYSLEEREVYLIPHRGGDADRVTAEEQDRARKWRARPFGGVGVGAAAPRGPGGSRRRGGRHAERPAARPPARPPAQKASR